MKQKRFNLAHDEAKGECLAFISRQPIDGSIKVVISNEDEGKTIRQLGGLFGSWEKHLSEEWGYSLKEVHDWLKASFLARVYITDNATDSVNDAQAQWVELLAVYQMNGETEKLERHAKRISLSWATLKQMKRFMDDIESHFQSIGQPLPILDPAWKSYESEVEVK